jgi:hypothetical protein
MNQHGCLLGSELRALQLLSGSCSQPLPAHPPYFTPLGQADQRLPEPWAPCTPVCLCLLSQFNP